MKQFDLFTRASTCSKLTNNAAVMYVLLCHSCTLMGISCGESYWCTWWAIALESECRSTRRWRSWLPGAVGPRLCSWARRQRLHFACCPHWCWLLPPPNVQGMWWGLSVRALYQFWLQSLGGGCSLAKSAHNRLIVVVCRWRAARWNGTHILVAVCTWTTAYIHTHCTLKAHALA